MKISMTDFVVVFDQPSTHLLQLTVLFWDWVGEALLIMTDAYNVYRWQTSESRIKFITALTFFKQTFYTVGLDFQGDKWFDKKWQSTFKFPNQILVQLFLSPLTLHCSNGGWQNISWTLGALLSFCTGLDEMYWSIEYFWTFYLYSALVSADGILYRHCRNAFPLAAIRRQTPQFWAFDT